tara:strand:+ start:229 stop:2115 length:1887 start_codon:yes stop_codon:yes gene_type:complete
MPYTKLTFAPGINREGTDYSNEGGWFNANLVRFRQGRPEKIGGWVKETSTSYLGTGRALHGWVDVQGTKYLGLGTTFKYYVSTGENFDDITPVRKTTTNGILFAATNSSSTITATDNGHGCVTNDFVTIAGAASLGGLITAAVLNQEYQITSVTTNTYTFTAKDTSGATVTANSSDSGNGGSGVDGVYQINVGLDTYVQSTGWGANTWGEGTFGSSSAISSSNQLRLWSHDNFGEDLLMNVRGGGIYYWDESEGSTVRAKDISDLAGSNLAPTVALQVLVSDIDRHVLCFGADPIDDAGVARTSAVDPMLIAWSDQENVLEWEPLFTNTAGSLRLSAGSLIVGAMRAGQETLVWTDTSLYNLQFIGPPYVFGTTLLNEGVGLISPKAAVNTAKGIFWMDRKGFYNYAGTVQPVPCSVHNYVFSDLNEGQSYKVFGFLNKQFNEVGWFYPSNSSGEIDKYVIYNYEEGSWSIGELARFAWLDEGIVSYPRATGKDTSVNYLYQQETGNDDDGSPMTNVFIESSDMDIQDGELFSSVNKLIPDVKFLGSSGSTQTINFVLKSRNFPGESLTTNTTQNVTSSTTRLDTRLRARQVVLRIESDDDNSDSGTQLGVGWRLGDVRMDVKPSGRR